jgi:hypothetical protein
MRRFLITALSAVLLAATHLPAARAADDDKGADDGLFKKQLFDRVRTDLIGKTFSVEKPLVEEYKDQNLRVETWRETRCANLLGSPDGFQFDRILTIVRQKSALDKEGAAASKETIVSVWRYEVRPFAPNQSFVGIVRLVSDSARDSTLGVAESVEVRLDGKALVVLQEDVQPRVDPNDKAVVEGQTTVTFAPSDSGVGMQVAYVEHAVDPKTREKGKKRFDAHLDYRQAK